MPDFEIKILKRVRFFMKKNLYFKISPQSTTYIFRNVFLHITMNSYNLQYPPSTNNSTHNSNSCLCTHFRKDFVF